MVDKYEYHKQNEYPGERVAERKRVAEREEEADKKADARVAAKGRQNDRMMDSQRERSESRARSVNRSTNTTYTIGVFIIVGLFLLLLVLASYSFISMRNQNNEISALTARVSQASYDNDRLNAENNRLLGRTDTIAPTVLYDDLVIAVSPSDSERFVKSDAIITVTFSEDMNPATINKDTFTVRQRLASVSESYRSQTIIGDVTYNKNNRQAIFTPRDGLYANQVYGDVFVVTITTGVKDLAGDTLKDEYKWSFTTSKSSFNMGGAT